MKRQIFFLFFLCVGYSNSIIAQIDSIQRLDEVVLSDVMLKRYASGYKVTIFNDSVIKKNESSLTNILRFNTNIYFKENGYGMVSSPSFRGTNASQTAVVWNGININSQLNGQVDFNTIGTQNYNSISIRNGGGSVQYGSGAIGGSVHLNNSLEFLSHFKNELKFGYGSFDTKKVSYTSSLGNKKLSSKIGIAHTNSQNDYEFLGTDKKNKNGAFNNLDLSLSLGYVISKKDVLKINHQSVFSERELSSTIVAPSDSKYENKDFRSMLEWVRVSENVSTSLKAVHLSEEFKYFENKESPIFSIGKANTWLVKYNFNYRFSKTLDIVTIANYKYINASGSSFGSPKQDVFSVTSILSHKALNKLKYSLSIRQDVISDFKSPLVFSVDANYKISKHYVLKINGSKNYRTPTFNDLYWQPGGNLDLKPESSYQVDLGHDVRVNEFNFRLNTFYIKSKDLIQWRPNNSGYWSPVNIASAKYYGLEAEFDFVKQINKYKINLSSGYSYTVSEDIEKKRQLIYVPFHKANASISCNYKSFTLFYQHLFNGMVFITDDNLIGGLFSLNSFDVANIGFNYKILNSESNILDLGFKINNLYNEVYQNVISRPMPNRNFNIQINYKF